MGEDVTDMATTTSQLQAKLLALTGGQVNIMADANTFKNSTQILREMAEAWEDMTDIQRASALELMGGKRQANTLSALIQNFDTVEKVIETSSKSAGSALEENERYLDSIQGKIDQFNNTMQAMWSNTLDSDMVKGFVSFGTLIIKVIDKIGLLNSALIALSTISMIKNKMGPIAFLGGISDIIRNVAGKVGGFIGSLMGMTTATSAYTAETLAASVANGTLSASEAANIATKNGLTLATTKLNAAEAVELLTKGGMQKADALAIVSKLGLSTATKKLTVDILTSKMAAAGYTKEQIAAATAALFGAGANKTLAASFGALWTAIWPILAVMAAIAVIYGVVKMFDAMVTTTSELQEELDGMKSSLSDVRDELDSVNQELETTNKRMEELLAKDSLSFVEQEELDKLKETNAELERRKAMLEAQEEYERERVGRQAAEVVNSKREEIGWWFNGKSEEEEVYDDINEYLKVQKEIEKIESQLANKNLSSDKREDLNEELRDLKEDLDEEKADVSEYIDVLTEALSGVEYGDSEESDVALDYYHELLGYWNVKQGAPNAKGGEIKSVLSKKEFSNISNEIDQYVEALKGGDESAAVHIEKIIKNNSDLAKDLKARGVEIQDAVDYFTQLGQEANFATLEGKIAEMQTATSKIQTLLANTKSADFTGLFDEDGEVSKTAIAEYFKGTSEATRVEIAKLVKDINEGEISVENALKQFELFSIESSLNIYIGEVQTNFKDVFVELEDADGLISTFEELGEAIGSTANALEVFNKAEKEMSSSGRVSIQTALELMEYTDDYGSILQVVDGKLQLVDNAEEVLIQTRIDAIKTSAQASLADAQSAYDKAKLATETYKSALETDMSASVVASSWEKVLAAGAGLWEGIKSLVTDESWTDAYNRGYNATLENITGYETTYDDVGLQALVDAENEAKEALDEANDRVELTSQLTPDTLKSINEDTDGDDDGIDDDKEDAIADGWEKLLAEYENKLALITNERDLIQAEIDRMEAQGGKASAQYYEDLLRSSAEEKALLEQKKAALEEYLAANADSIDQDTWTEYNNTINETAVAIKECEVNTIEWAEAVREIDLHYFEQITDEVSRLGEELDFVNSLLEDEEVADENGNWSSAALTRMGLYTQQMEMAAVEAARYQEEIDDLNEEYENGALSEEQYQEKLSDLVSGQQDAIGSYEDAKDSIVELNEARIDAIKEGIEKEIEAYEDLIDAKKEELDAERDLHDFRENIKDQTKDIASLERRIAALSGSSAASDIAERRKLEEQLQQAKEGLNDTYYDHSRDAQSAALDEEAEAYTLSKERYIERLEEQLKDQETLIQNSIMDVMLNADTVYTELNELADLYGVDLSDSLTLPWKNASAQAIAWKNELQTSMTSGEYAALIGEGGAVTAFANGVATKLQGSWAKAQTAAKNYAGYLTGAELKNRFTSTLTGFGNQIQAIIDKWNGVKKAADDAYAAQTREVTVGGVVTPTTGSDSNGSGGGGNTGATTTTKATTPTVKLRGLMKTSREMILGSKSFVDKNTETINGTKYYRDSKTGYYYKISDLNSKRKYDGGRTTGWAIPKGTWFYTKHAQGTTGTTRDEWAITDEPQFGDELVLVPTPQGNLSYMRKGTGVVPADLTANLMEWGQFTPDSLNLGGGINVNMINNAVNKPEFNFAFDALVKAENITEETLPAVKKLVTQELNRFTKELNYALKGKGAR